MRAQIFRQYAANVRIVVHRKDVGLSMGLDHVGADRCNGAPTVYTAESARLALSTYFSRRKVGDRRQVTSIY